MSNEHNPLRHLDLASQHTVMQALGWMWSMLFSLMFLSILEFGVTWMLHLLLTAGAFLTISVFKQAEKQQVRLAHSVSRAQLANVDNAAL